MDGRKFLHSTTTAEVNHKILGIHLPVRKVNVFNGQDYFDSYYVSS